MQLSFEQPLAPDTRYEVAARRPEGYHPSRWVFGSFTTGAAVDNLAPRFDVRSAHHYSAPDNTGVARRWLELQIAVSDGGRSNGVLFAVRLPDARGRANVDAPPDAHLPFTSDTLRIGALELCSSLHVTLPELRGPAEIALAALDVAGHRSAPIRVAIDFGAVERRGSK